MRNRLLIHIYLGLFFVSCNGLKHHNKLDDITNTKEIERLVSSINSNYSNFKINPQLKFTDKDCQKLYDSLKLEPFTKADFDNNGYTDLLVIGHWSNPAIICILDSGQNKFSIKRLTKGLFQGCSFPKILTNENETYIDYYYFKEPDWRNNEFKGTIKSKRLIYKFGDFVEYNSSKTKYDIQKIEYKTTMCFGTCPEFELTINSDRKAKYNALQYNKPDGKFNGIIDQKKYDELVELLNYIDFPNLKESYSVSWTDDQTCSLKITYDNGKTKIINDYGLIGTFGLDRTYDMLFNLRKNQTWK
jgi:hypothetical protein